MDHLRDDLGSHGLQVERSETDDEFVLGQWIEDNMSRVSQYPHAFVWLGSIQTRGADSTRRMGQITVPVRVFIMTRDNSRQNEKAQKKLADKWSLAVVASLVGEKFGDPQLTNDGLVQNLSVDTLGNGEDAAMWEASFDLDLSIDFDEVINNL